MQAKIVSPKPRKKRVETKPRAKRRMWRIGGTGKRPVSGRVTKGEK